MEEHQYKLEDKCNSLCCKIKNEGGVVERTKKGKEKQKGLKLKTIVEVSKMYCLQK